MPARETYAAARARILGDLATMGWTVRAGLKVPWAEPPDRAYKLWFRPQAVYRNEHSMWLDIRGMDARTLVAAAEAWGSVRRTSMLARAVTHVVQAVRERGSTTNGWDER